MSVSVRAHVRKRLAGARRRELRPAADPRFSPMVLEMRTDAADAVGRYLAGSYTIASATDGKYTVVILPISEVAVAQAMRAKNPVPQGHVLYIDNEHPDEPAPSGWWMDWPEEHWGLSTEQYYGLPREKRAELEAKEQLKYVPWQYKIHWLETYAPDVYDDFWWDRGGARLAFDKGLSSDEFQREIGRLYDRARSAKV